MESVTSVCDTEIPLQMHKTDAFTASYMKSLESVRATAQQATRYQVQLEEVKGKLWEAEDDLVKALAVKTRKEARRMALMDAIASAKARNEDLKTSIREHRPKKQQYAAFLSRQSLALAASEGKLNESIEQKHETQEPISWYNRVLGFHVEGGRVLTTVEREESAFTSASAPVLSMSSVRSDSPTKENENRVEPTEGDTHIKKQNVRKRVKSSVRNAGSASSVRQSPRLKLQK